MKKSVLVFISFLMLSTITFAGTAPAAVQKAFEKKFAKAQDVKWEQESANNYEASFVSEGVNYSANFSDTGEWLETESPFTFNQLPKKVQEAFTASNKGDIVKGVSKIEIAKRGIIYEIEIFRNAIPVELFYAPNGTVTKE